jgi:anti-sigma regulatory factor (Ser/Thr protein kinase)/CheY-like chemotaxis protein
VEDPKAARTDIVLVQTADPRGAHLRDALAMRPGIAVVEEVVTTVDAVATARRLQPHVIVLDVGLQELAGHGLVRSLRAVTPATRIVLHAHAAEVDDAPGSARWIAHLVDGVIDPRRAAALEARLVLADAATSVPEARAFVSELLVEWDLECQVAACGLVASELVANAVRHVTGPCALEVTHRSALLRVAVADEGPGVPDVQVLGPTNESGRGLHIVAAFSDAWGIDQLDDGGKLVWAELAAPRKVDAR